MAKAPAREPERHQAPVSAWIERLTQLTSVVDVMEPAERKAAFTFLSSRYSADWPD